MKVIVLRTEAERLNVPIGEIKTTYEKALNKGRIQGWIDKENEEAVSFKTKELEDLSSLLNTEKISTNKLAENLKIRESHVRKVLSILSGKQMIDGIINDKDWFVPRTILYNEFISIAERKESLDIEEIASELQVPRNEIQKIIESITRKIRNASTVYNQVKIADLSQEIGFSPSLTVQLLKLLIREGNLNGKLDLVNNLLIMEGSSDQLTRKREALKVKFAKGEITRAQYEDMKNLLMLTPCQASETAEFPKAKITTIDDDATSRYTETKTIEKNSTAKDYFGYFLMFMGGSSLFGGAWTYLTSVGTIIQDISAAAATPYVVGGSIMLAIGFFIKVA